MLAKLAEARGATIVDLSDFPVGLRADDAWPKDEGLDWIADQIAAAFPSPTAF